MGQRLLQLEEEAELLNKKLEQKEVVMKNRDLKINELQAQLEDLTLQHARETKVVARNNSLKLRNLEAEKEQMEESVNKYKEKAKISKAELRVKDNLVDKHESELEKIKKAVERKDRDIRNLKDEIASLKRENANLKSRIEKLKE